MAQQTFVKRSDGVTTVTALQWRPESAQSLLDFVAWLGAGNVTAQGVDQLVAQSVTLLPHWWLTYDGVSVYAGLNPDNFAATYDPQTMAGAETEVGVPGSVPGATDQTTSTY